MIAAVMLAATATLLAPVDTWAVDYDGVACMLARSFGEGKNRVMFVIRQPPLADAILFVRQGGGGDWKFGTATVTFQPSGTVARPAYSREMTVDQQARVSKIAFDRTMRAALAKSTEIQIDIPGGLHIRLPMAQFGAGNLALRRCNDTLLKRWGMDPAEQDTVPQPPVSRQKPPPSIGFASNRNYPKSLLRKDMGGRAVTAVLIGIDGNISDCRVIESSSEPEFNEIACQTVANTMTFEPARNAAGQAVPGHSIQRITWGAGPPTPRAAPKPNR